MEAVQTLGNKIAQKGSGHMTLDTFLQHHAGGYAQQCISIDQMPFNFQTEKCEKTYFEKEAQEEILKTKTYEKIKNKRISHFGIYYINPPKAELYICLKEESEQIN